MGFYCLHGAAALRVKVYGEHWCACTGIVDSAGAVVGCFVGIECGGGGTN